MSHFRSRAALRLLTTALLAASITNAVALPAPDASTNELPSPSDVEAALAVAAAPQENYFDEMEDGLRSRTGLQLVKDFFARLFGFDPDSSSAATTVTVTVSVTPSSSIVTPPGPPSSSSSTVDMSTPASSSPTPETTPAPTDIYSILPVGSMTTAINMSLPDPIFSTSTSIFSPVPILPPYPLNSSLSLGPTAAIITGYFSTNPLSTGLPIANASTNTTVTLTSEYTSIILVTGTGTGTSLPTDAAAPLWTNSSSASTPPSTTAPLGTAIPLYPNTTLVVPIVVNATGSPGTVLNVTLPLTLATATSTFVAGTAVSEAGYGAGYGSVTAPYGNTTVGAATGLGTAVSTSTSTTTTTVVEVPTDVAVPVLGEGGYEDLTPLLTICSNPRITTLTLPLLSLFYSPNDPANPVLAPFPGCIPSSTDPTPNLHNCTLLGSALRTCRVQRPDLRILLSVKASSLSGVAGNALFGDPDVGEQPFGAVFSPSSSAETGPTGTEGEDGGADEAVVEPIPSITPPTSPGYAGGFPNLFNANHTPAALAETLVSLFGPVSSSSTSSSPSYPRPLGPDTALDGFDVQVPVQWKGTYQDRQFHVLVEELKERSAGGVVFFGWVGEMVGRRGVEMGMEGREGWVECGGMGV